MNRLFLSLFSGLLLVCAVLVGGYWHDAYVAQPAPDAKTVELVVKSGESLKVVAQKLKDSGVINSLAAFELFAKVGDQAKRLQAGTFQLKQGMSFEDVMNALSNAGSADVQVTIPEGKTAQQTFDLVHAALPTVTQDEWTRETGPNPLPGNLPWGLSKAAAAALPSELSARGLEGFLFPDTYRFVPQAKAADVVGDLTANFLAKTQGLGVNWADTAPRALGEKKVELTPYQIVVLASIVEREVRSPEDMKNVAGVFLKRLDAKMPLQADSTVNYVTGAKTPSISLADAGLDSPYNTYKNQGLPPGPISNPGLNALDAVLHPSANAWYYFLTTPDGAVKYARTYDEHVANKQKYLK